MPVAATGLLMALTPFRLPLTRAGASVCAVPEKNEVSIAPNWTATSGRASVGTSGTVYWMSAVPAARLMGCTVPPGAPESEMTPGVLVVIT
jgi:hypothetical protein